MPVAIIDAVPFASPASLMYLIVYTVMDLALYAAVAALPDRQSAISRRGAGSANPVVSSVILVELLRFALLEWTYRKLADPRDFGTYGTEKCIKRCGDWVEATRQWAADVE
jgi:hypothetical protein